MTRAEDRGMTAMPEIRCSHPADHLHVTRLVTVDLEAMHGYADYPQVPAPPSPFQIEVWDWRAAPPIMEAKPEDGYYCPAADTVSETIVTQGIWEPVETIAMISMFRQAKSTPGEVWQFVDVGAQLGWYSVLASIHRLHVHAIEADPDVAAVLERNLMENSHVIDAGYDVYVGRVPGADLGDFLRIPAIAKIDIEGAEGSALELMEHDLLDTGLLKGLLIELSPVFGVDTDAIVDVLMRHYRFAAHFLPPKMVPPVPYRGIAGWGDGWTDADAVAKAVREHEQVNLVFTRR